MRQPEDPAPIDEARPRRLRRTFSQLTRPHDSVQSEPDRRRVRMAASLTLLLLALVSLVFLFSLTNAQGDLRNSAGILITEVLTAATLLGSYALVRSPRPRMGSLLGLSAIAAPVWAVWLDVELGGQESDVVYFLLLPILLAPLFFRFRVATALVAVNAVAISLGHRAVHAWTLEGSVVAGHQNLLFLVLFVGAIAVLSSYLIETYLQLLDNREWRLRQANEQLLGADRQRLSFVNTIAHDLGGPLTPIKLQLHLLRNAPNPPPEKAMEILERNTNQMGRLVDDLRDVGKLESGHLKLDPQTFDLPHVVQHCVDSYLPLIAAQGIRLDVNKPEKLPVTADEGRVTQVLTNFLTNAKKFTPAGGRIVVRVAPRGDHALVEVEDSGRGLTEDEMARLFRPFSQVHARGETKERGTGLGLFICKRLIEGHGGTIGVRSPGRGQGSTFWFTLPLQSLKAEG